MREIKFRAWDSKRNLLLRIGLIDISSNTIYNAKSEDGYEFSYVDKESKRYFEDKENWGVYQDLIIMQYTGVKDKNGVEIYERDIVWDDHKEEYGLVVFEGGEYLCEWETHADSLCNELDYIEAIGNIYEHKHLLS